MILDITDLENGSILQADVCVIGSGAAGVTVAREFIGTRHSVVVLEAGGTSFEQPSQDPYRSLVTGLKHGGVNTGRVRVLGGSTTLWAGQALPLFEIDFAEREWVPYSGWPIKRSELTPFYHRAESVMQIPHALEDEGFWPARRKATYDPQAFVTVFSQFTATPNFAHKYRPDIADAPNIRLVTHANVTSLDANAQASRLSTVSARSMEAHRISVEARYFVICCGGIETARLLLLSNSVEPSGIGNQHDVVGRYFQDHPGLALPVVPADRKTFSTYYDSARRNGIRYSIKIAASEALQRREKMLHVGAEIYYPSQENDPIAAAKDLLKILRDRRLLSRLPAALGGIARSPHKVASALYRHFIQGIPPSVGSTTPHLGIGSEQQPNPQSRVMLSDEKDILGLRRTILDWRLTSLDSYSFRSYLTALAAEWKRMGVAAIDPESIEVTGRELGEHGGYVDANHHMGTTRMGLDRRTSVVDRSCRVHGYENLYIGSSAVFPTGGFSNPTLTVIALCLRIADELKQHLIK